jgi:hypothetical protein
VGSITPIGVTRMGDAIMDYELDTLDEARLRADDLDVEARNSVTFQGWLEEMSELKPSEQRAVMNALNDNGKLSRWIIEIVTTAAFERAVQTKIKEL